MGITEFPRIERYAPEGTELVEPDEHSHFGHHIPDIIRQYGSMKTSLSSRMRVMGKMVRGLSHMRKSYTSVRRNPATGKTRATDAFLRELEELARGLGCAHIGYTQVPRSMVFSNKKILFDKAIVLTMEMEPARIRTAPGPQAGKEVWRTYERLGSIVNRIAAVLRSAGYRAQAGSPLGGDVSYPMLAQKAGIGYMGKHGLLITPDTGPSLRIAAVYTEIENLPYTDHSEHAWVRDFCESCLKCVRSCPAGAIYRQDRVYEDGSRQCIDYTKCAKPFSDTLGCSVCIRDCTFFTGDYHKIKRAWSRPRGGSTPRRAATHQPVEGE